MAKNAVDTLNHLLKVDHNAVGLYDKVLEKLSDGSPHRSQVQTFKGDHERHIDELTAEIRRLGGNPSERSTPMGPAAKMMTSLDAAIKGDKGALEGLKQGEEYTTSSYGDEDGDGLPPDVAALIRRNGEDEQRHLRWVEGVLAKL